MSRRIVRVYVAGPYTRPDPVRNTAIALNYANLIWNHGYVPFVPHLTMLWDFYYPRTYEEWLAYDAEWLKTCDVVFRIAGESDGADKECELAKSLGIPVVTSFAELKARSPLT